MAIAEPHVGDIGVAIIYEVKRGSSDVTEDQMGSATGLILKFTPPSGTTVNKTATLYTDGSDGKIQYVTQSGDLDEDGTWEVQPYFTLGSFTGHASRRKFEVRPNL